MYVRKRKRLPRDQYLLLFMIRNILFCTKCKATIVRDQKNEDTKRKGGQRETDGVYCWNSCSSQRYTVVASR